MFIYQPVNSNYIIYLSKPQKIAIFDANRLFERDRERVGYSYKYINKPDFWNQNERLALSPGQQNLLYYSVRVVCVCLFQAKAKAELTKHKLMN